MISKIEGTGSIRTSQSVRKAKKANRTGGTSFSSHLEGPSETSPAQDTSEIGNVAGILGLQEVDDALSGASKGKLRAEDILDKLDDIKLALLEGSLSEGKLNQLSKTVNMNRGDVKDAHLNGILDEIDLRAQVELAKFSAKKN